MSNNAAITEMSIPAI